MTAEKNASSPSLVPRACELLDDGREEVRGAALAQVAYINSCLIVRIAAAVACFCAVTSTLMSQVTNDQCFTCHGNTTLIKTITLSSGATETVPLYVDRLKITAGRHGTLQCIECHTDITTMAHGPLQKTYGGWARFSAKNDTVTPGGERTRNYYTAASLSCSKTGCHSQHANFTNSAHHTIWRQRQAHVRTVNGESVGEAFAGNDCNRCHRSRKGC